MTTYELFHPDTEIIGQVILDFESTIGGERFKPLLEQVGLSGIRADVWYPAQPWVDFLNLIKDQGGQLFDFVSLGIRQIELAVAPPEFDDMEIPEILAQLDEAYRMNYRGSDIGEISVEVAGDDIIVSIRSFEPDNLWFGNIHGIIRRYGRGESYLVYFDDDLPRREQGGDVTVIHVRRNW